MFNPHDVYYTQSTLSFEKLKDKFEIEKEFTFRSSYVEFDYHWNVRKASLYIESILLGIPLNPFYFDYSTETNSYQAILFEGKNRLFSVFEFMNKESFKLSGLQYYPNLNGLSFSEIPRPLQRKLEDSEVCCYFISPGTPVKVTENLIQRIKGNC
jgi:hypothetical protein